MEKSPEQMTTAELKALLKEKEAKEQKAQRAAKMQYLEDKELFLKEAAMQFVDVQDILKALKKQTINYAEELEAKKYKLDKKEQPERKTFQLNNNTIKLVVEIQERFGFNDEAVVHITAIRELFKDKFQDRNKGFYGLLDSILMRNTKGDYDAKLLTKARRQVRKIGDERLTMEFDKLQDCLEVTGSAKYVRLYVKDENSNRWEDVSLNFSRM